MVVPTEHIYNGPNSESVNEVIEFAFSETIVERGAITRNVDSKSVVSDLMAAVDLAGAPRSYWSETRSSQAAKHIYTAAYYPWEKANRVELRKVKSLAVQYTENDPTYLFDHLRSRMPEGPIGPDGTDGYYREFAINSIACDIMQCCENRAFNGTLNNFWERLFGAYLNGGWPCGEIGWPTGHHFDPTVEHPFRIWMQ